MIIVHLDMIQLCTDPLLHIGLIALTEWDGEKTANFQTNKRQQQGDETLQTWPEWTDLNEPNKSAN